LLTLNSIGGERLLFENIEFKYPQNAPFFLLAIAAALFFFLAFKKKGKIMTALHLDGRIRFIILRTLLLFIAFSLMIFSLLGPQVFAGYSQVNKFGLSIYILIDTSKSMLVSDIPPDRLTAAKRIIGNLLDNLDGDKIGFIPFASDAYIQMPLTDDYELAHMFLDVMDTYMIGGGGSNIGAALQLANNSFDRTSSSDRVIIVLSDGEEHDETSLRVLEEINDNYLRVFTVGLGTERGGLIPIYDNSGEAVIDYIRDESGSPVTSSLNAELLQKLAKAGNGSYFQATAGGAEAYSLIEELSGLRRGILADEQIRRFNPIYQGFLGAGLLLFMIVWLIPEGARIK
jgi:Ca-activated chloride channel family protein